MAGRNAPLAPAPSATAQRIAERFALKERALSEEESPVFGPLLLRELTRRQWREASKESQVPGDPTKIMIDEWNAGVFARGCIDPETSKPLFANADVVLDLPRSDEVWNEILRLGNLILELSEVGQEALKSEDPPAGAE